MIEREEPPKWRDLPNSVDYLPLTRSVKCGDNAPTELLVKASTLILSNHLSDNDPL